MYDGNKIGWIFLRNIKYIIKRRFLLRISSIPLIHRIIEIELKTNDNENCILKCFVAFAMKNIFVNI